MFYLYTKKKKFLKTYDNVFLCSKETGYDTRMLECLLENPGLVMCSLFASPYKWRNSKENNKKIADAAFNALSVKSKIKVLKMLNRE